MGNGKTGRLLAWGCFAALLVSTVIKFCGVFQYERQKSSFDSEEFDQLELQTVVKGSGMFNAVPNNLGEELSSCSTRGSVKEDNGTFKIHFHLFSFLTWCPSVNCDAAFTDLPDFSEQMGHKNAELKQKPESSNTLPKGTQRTSEMAKKQQPGQISMTDLSRYSTRTPRTRSHSQTKTVISEFSTLLFYYLLNYRKKRSNQQLFLNFLCVK